jgi:hypothetical protein
VLTILNQDYALPVTAAWVEISTILTNAQEEVLSDVKSPKAALDDAAARAQRALDRSA